MKKLLIFLTLLIAFVAKAQYSKTHYIAPIVANSNSSVLGQYLYISTPSTTPVHVRLLAYGTGISENTITRNTPWVVNLGMGFSQMAAPRQFGPQILTNKGYHIEATDLVNVSYRLNAVSNNHAGNIVSKGMAALGTSFRTFHMTPTQGNFLQGGFTNFISVLATESDTQVEFSNFGESAQDPLGNFYQGTLSVTLQVGETYILPAGDPHAANFTAFLGTKVSSNKPIVVNSGSFVGTNGEMSNADLGFDQLVPIERTGQEYIFVKSTGQSNVERVFIVADQDDTQVFAKGLPAVVATLNAGDWYSFVGNDFDFDGNLYVYTSKPTSAYQGIGDGQRGDQANQEMFFVPPLSCETPKNISSIPLIERIGNMLFTGRATLVTKTGSSINLIINENNYTLQELGILPDYTISGPHPVMGNNAYESYVITGLRGNVSVSSTSQLYLASYGTSQAATFGGYYSGFIYKPEITFQSSSSNLGSCIPNTTLAVNDVNGFDTYQWYRDNSPIAGATASTYQPTTPGNYYVIAFLTECNTQYVSDEIFVDNCPPDYDGDGIIDTIDLDWDGDGISNCAESYGSQPIAFTSNTAQISWPEGNRSYNLSLVNSGSGTPNSYLNFTPQGEVNISSPALSTSATEVDFQISELGALEILPVNQAQWNTNFEAEYRIRSTNLHHITLLNADNSLLIDTNFDGTFEPYVTQYTSFELRFKLNEFNAANPVNFQILTASNDRFSIEVRNSHNSLDATISLAFTATCLPKDTDGDGIADQWDIDSDNDGIADYWEQIGHLGLATPLLDVNENGWADVFENLPPTDTDQDGIANYLDWDADNNGIYDRVESQLSTTITNSGQYTAVNGYGGPTGLAFSDPLSVYANPPLASNPSGIGNAFTLDNDADGCWDTTEADINDPDNDGIPGNSTPSVGATGLLSGFNYSAVVYNTLINEAHLLTLLTEIEFPVVCLNQTLVLPIDVASNVLIQWQYSSNDIDFINLPENAMFQGTTSASLTIPAQFVTSDLANYYFRIQLSNPQAPCSNETQAFQLNLQQGSIPAQFSVTQCENEEIADGITDFDLTYISAQLTANDPDIVINWFASQADVAANTPLNGIWQNQSNPQVLLLQVQSLAQGCSYIQEVVFEVPTVGVTTLQEWTSCDTYQNPSPGTATFDLTQAVTQQIGAGIYTFHSSLADALLSQSAITNPAQYTLTLDHNPTVIYVRKGENWNSCEGIYALPLRLLELPVVDANLERIPHVICSASSTISDTIYALTDVNLATAYTYSWYLNDVQIPGANSFSLTINQTGAYHVVVRTPENCTVTRYIPVTHSSTAVVDQVYITDFLDERTVNLSLELPAYGEYEYSLDVPAAFQPSPYFTGVAPGRHILYINDKNGCGITAHPIYVLGIPPFFTPNADGYNDTWNAWGDDPHNPRLKTIHIYDRFGKLLLQIDPRGTGWDGKLNGRNLPSTDYWYRIETLDGEFVRGHFTLKR